MIKINEYIDHTLLKAVTTEEDITELCQEAKDYNFFSVCVNSSYIALARKELEGTKVKICSVVGFPLGAMSSEAKVYEAKKAVADGATEIDMVLNIGALKSQKFDLVENDIREIKSAIGTNVLKVIIETCYLTREEIVVACKLAVKAEADFVKTSTGFGTGGAEEDNITIMKKAVEGRAKIKASGGIKNLDTALRFIELGVERIGTSSGVSIVKELQK